MKTQLRILNCISCGSRSFGGGFLFLFCFCFFNERHATKLQKEWFTLHTYHVTLENASLPIGGKHGAALGLLCSRLCEG